MTPTPSNPFAAKLHNPSLPQAKTVRLKQPFGGVYRSNYAPSPEGNLWYLHKCTLKDGTIGVLPGYTSTSYTMTKMPWATTEETRGVINKPDGSDFWVVTDHRVHRQTFVADPINYVGVIGDGTRGAAGPPGTIDFSGTTLLTSGIMYGAKIKIADDATYYTCDGINSDTQMRTVEALPSFTSKEVTVWNMGFTGTTQGWYGPRYCWFGTSLIMASLWGVCSYDPAVGGYLSAITLPYRGVDVINFAGRPVLLGVVDTSPANYDDQEPTLLSDLMRWPTRGDFTDWDSYGSGFLYLHSDGSGIRCGATMGRDGYVFTGSGIYQLIETGISAANPIARQKHTAVLSEAPVSNAVEGIRGIYFWSMAGPALFDGVKVHDLSKNFELDLGCRDSDLLGEGVHVWRDDYTRTIRFHRWDLETPVLQYIFWEDSGQWSTLDEDDMYLAGTGLTYSSHVGVLSKRITTSTIMSRVQNEEQGTIDVAGDTIVAQATWRGICMDEGPHVNKVIRHVRVICEVYNNSDVLLSIIPDTSLEALVTAALETIDSAPIENLVCLVFTPVTTIEAPIWRLDIKFGCRTRIHQVLIDYSVGGDVAGS